MKVRTAIKSGQAIDRRTMTQTAFQNMDQKTQQAYNLLSQVIKTMHEMQAAGTRRML